MEQLTANLCLTRDDIDDDARKGGREVEDTTLRNIPTTGPSRVFFDSCKNQLVSIKCDDRMLDKFETFIQNQIDKLTINTKSVYKTAIPIDTFVKRKMITNTGIKDILVRVITDTTRLLEGCAPFFFVKDNYGFKNIEERFILASFYDEGGRALRCGEGNSIREFLTKIYGGVSYTIDLFACGLTTFRDSSLTAHWDVNGDNVSVDPITKKKLVLTDSQILFTLQLNGEYVKCIFNYNNNGSGNYTNFGEKRPVSYSKTIVFPSGVNTNEFIQACFSGNPNKNQWFNENYKNVKDSNKNLFIKLGSFIQVGKAIGDASFVFSKNIVIPHPAGKKYCVGTSDKALGLRCCINDTDLMFTTTRGISETMVRYFLSVHMPMLLPPSSSSQSLSSQKTVSNKKTKAKKKVERKKKTLYIDTNNTLKKKLDMLGRRGDYRSYRLQLLSLGRTPDGKSNRLFRGIQKGGDENIESVSMDIINTTADDSSDPEYDFKNFTYEYLRQILYFFEDCVQKLSEVKTILSEFEKNDTVTYDNINYRINKNYFNLDVKIQCVDIVIKFLNFLVDKIRNDAERRILVNVISENIVKKELIFDIYNVFDNIMFGNTLLVPKPNAPEYMCGIPTTELFEGCYKLLSYLDGIPDFPENFFKPIYEIITALNKKSGSTGKTYTINTIFSDIDSQHINASSIQKRKDQLPYVYLLQSVKTEVEKYPQPDSIEYQELLNDITRLLSVESSKMEKYELYNEISKTLIKSFIVIEYYDLLLMIVSSFIDDALIATVIRNELFRFISIRGTYIFDIKIIEAFIDGLDVNENMGSIIYKPGYDTIDALINVKQYFDGDLIDTLNDNGFSLKEIGDFMNNLVSEVEEQDLTDEEIDQLISTSLDPFIQQLEQKEHIQQRLDIDPMGLKQPAKSLTKHITLVSPVLGGNNKRKSKYNANYRKKYKKFVNKYIVKKKKNKNKYNTKKNNKNKTRKNKKSKKPKSKRNNKTVKKTTGKSSNKPKFNSNHKSKHNKKIKTNYYNPYKHNKTQKH